MMSSTIRARSHAECAIRFGEENAAERLGDEAAGGHELGIDLDRVGVLPDAGSRARSHRHACVKEEIGADDVATQRHGSLHQILKLPDITRKIVRQQQGNGRGAGRRHRRRGADPGGPSGRRRRGEVIPLHHAISYSPGEG